MSNSSNLLYLTFLKRKLPDILVIMLFFIVVSLLVPGNWIQLLVIVLGAVSLYSYIMEQEKGFLLDVIKNHTVEVDMDKVNDQELVTGWRQYTAAICLIFAFLLMVLGGLVKF